MSDKYEDLKSRVEKLFDVVQREKAQVAVEEKERNRLTLARVGKENDNALLLKVVELLKTLGGQSQEELLSKLELFVSYGLSAVFGEDYRFVTCMVTEGKDIKVDFFIETSDLKSGVANAKGGGVAEVVSLLLQLFFIVVLGDKFARVLVLDTAMVHISDYYRPKVSGLLKELSEKLNLQIILIVNTMEYGEYADKIYKFFQKEGKTFVEEGGYN